jgi:hypothetical protein
MDRYGVAGEEWPSWIDDLAREIESALEEHL